MPLFGPSLFNFGMQAVSSLAGGKAPFGTKKRRRRRRTLTNAEKSDIMFLKQSAGKSAIAAYLSRKGM